MLQKLNLKFFLTLTSVLVALIFFASVSNVYADETDDKLKAKSAEIAELEKKLSDTRKEASTLKSQLDYIDGQTKLTELKIEEAEFQITKLNKEITDLSGRIDRVSTTVDSISELLLARIVSTYKYSDVSPIQLFFSSHGFADVLERLKQFQVVQAYDKKQLYELQATKNLYNDQKTDKETRQAQQEKLQKSLEQYQKQLIDQKSAKAELLRLTRNDEQKYQQLLAQSKAEYLAIQGIVAGRGTESQVRDVSAGEKIASIINGPSCNSHGAHLHFSVIKSGSAQNPFSYLKGISSENCSGSSCGSGDADPFNPSGSWDWPINGPITLNQGFGSNTWAIRNKIVWYPMHDGLDIEGSSLEVKAVQNGTLYRGSYSGNSGCALPYVRVKHKDGGIDTLYLHVYYN